MRFTGSCVQFEFDPVESHVSPRQVTLLLEGLGYDQVTCVTDDAGMVHVVAIWCFGKAPKDRSHEMTALWGILGKRIPVAFYQLRPSHRVCHSGQPTRRCTDPNAGEERSDRSPDSDE